MQTFIFLLLVAAVFVLGVLAFRRKPAAPDNTLPATGADRDPAAKADARDRR